MRDCAEARERYSVATKEIHRLRSYVADLAAALVTSTKAMTVAQGEVAEARAQVKDLCLVRLAGWLDGWLISCERKILLAGWLAGGWADFA